MTERAPRPDTHAALVRAVETRLGLRLRPAVQALVREAADGLFERQSVTAEALLARLQGPSEDALVQVLVGAASVRETSFFRAPSQLKALEEVLVGEVLPRKRARGESSLSAWSAGCSTGEEAYTLSILLRRIAPELRVEVVGTDIHEASLEAARKGCYGARSLRGVPAELFPVHFSPTEVGYQVDGPTRAAVRFLSHNLVKDPCPDPRRGLCGFDLVLCRNVLIYVAPEERPGVVHRLAQALKPSGALVVAAPEYNVASHLPGFASPAVGVLVRR